MTELCCVPGCRLQLKQSVTIHRMPKDTNIREQIVENLGFADGYQFISNNRICSGHFKPTSFVMSGERKIFSKTVTLVNEFRDSDNFSSFEELKQLIETKLKKFIVSGWKVHTEGSSVCLYLLQSENGDIIISRKILIRYGGGGQRRKVVTAEFQGRSLSLPSNLTGKHHEITLWSQLSAIINFVTSHNSNQHNSLTSVLKDLTRSLFSASDLRVFCRRSAFWSGSRGTAGRVDGSNPKRSDFRRADIIVNNV